MIMRSFINLVTAKMRGQRISIRKVAREAGLDPSFFSKVLLGKRSPPSDEKVLRKLAKLLRMDPSLLIISTGTIPSELQPFMEKPEFLKQIRKGHFQAQPPLLLKEERKNSKISSRIAIIPKSSDLSDDLL